MPCIFTKVCTSTVSIFAYCYAMWALAINASAFLMNFGQRFSAWTAKFCTFTYTGVVTLFVKPLSLQVGKVHELFYLIFLRLPFLVTDENRTSVKYSLEKYLPYSIDHGEELQKFDAILNNVFYLSVWAIFHSLMARQPIKKKLLETIPESLERPLYVLQSAFLLHKILRKDSEP